jgi:Regulator of ribonuclease activity B
VLSVEDVTYEHFSYFPSEAAAQTFAADFQQRGVLVEVPRPAATGTDWLVMTYTAFDDRSVWADRFTEVAERLGGEYDGGGSFVGTLPTPGAFQSSAPTQVTDPSVPSAGQAQPERLWARLRAWLR